MTARYARNIFPPAHSGFAEEFESLEGEEEAMDWSGFGPFGFGRINQFAIDWAAQDERSAVAIWFRLRADGRNPAECVRYLEELRDCEAKAKSENQKPTEDRIMTQVPEAITARLQEIEDNIARARERQHRDATQAGELKAAIADRRRGIRGWKLQRDALRYAVDAIEGRVIHLGTVEIPATEPFVIERVAVPVRERPPKTVSQRQAGEPRPTPAKDAVYEVIKRLGPATAAEIAAETGVDRRGVGAIFGRLRKEGKATRTEEGLWGPTHQ